MKTLEKPPFAGAVYLPRSGSIRSQIWRLVRRIGLGFLATGQLMAQTTTVWDGGPNGTGSSWATTTNWNPDGALPNGVDSNVLINTRNGTGTISILTISGTRTLGLITFDNINSRLAATLNVDTNGSGTTAQTLNLHTGITLANSSSSVVFRGNNGTLTVNLAAPAIFSTSSGSTLEFSSSVLMTGSSRLTKTGLGTLTINGSKDLDGGVTISEGRLRISSGLALGLLPASPIADRITLNGGTLEYFGSTDFNSGVNRGFAVGNNGGTISVTGAGVYQISAALSNVAGQTGRLVKRGSGVLNLSSSSSSFSGGLEVLEGTLRFGFLSSLGGYPSAITSNQVVVNGGTLQFNGTSATSLVNRGFAIGDATGTFSVSNADGIFTINGRLTNLTSQTGSLSKTGLGTLRLTGSNAYTGLTTVSEGTLLINGDQSLATGNVSVATGATLGGTGIVGGATSVFGTHSPGTSAGLQTFLSDLTYESNASFEWELFSNTDLATDRGAAIGWDGVDVGGNLAFINPVTMSLVFNASGSTVNWSDALWSSNRQWLVWSHTTLGSSSGLGNLFISTQDWLDSAGNRFDTVLGGSFFDVFQSGEDVFLRYNLVPEPSRALLLLAGVLTMLRRRRRIVG